MKVCKCNRGFRFRTLTLMCCVTILTEISGLPELETQTLSSDLDLNNLETDDKLTVFSHEHDAADLFHSNISISQVSKTRNVCESLSLEPTDHLMTSVQLIRRDGYTAETHFVKTKDGYIFQIHRIPAPGKPVVYALHGFLQSSRDFLLNCDGRALAYKLVNDDYDVWLGNFRGNTYGRNHTKLSPKSKEFWSFSLDEIITYDGPAAVDYILNVTGQEKLNWIGYSFGNVVLFGMLSTHPEYNEKINLGVSMANAVLLGKTRSPALQFFSRIRRLVEMFVFRLWKGEAFARDLFLLYHVFAPNWCVRSTLQNRPSICPTTLWHVDGRDPKQLNHAYLPLAAGGTPSSTSARIVGQGLQWIATGKFAKYDFGTDKENLAKYKSIYPPTYNLSRVSIPILNFWSENDLVATKADAMNVMKQFPNVIDNIRVNWTEWNHLDYLYGKDADLLVYDQILKVLKQWNPFK